MKKLALIAIFAIFFSGFLTSPATATDAPENLTPKISICAIPAGFCGRYRVVNIDIVFPGGLPVREVQSRMEQGLGKDYVPNSADYFLSAESIISIIVETSTPAIKYYMRLTKNGYIDSWGTFIVWPGEHIRIILKTADKCYEPLINHSLIPFISMDNVLLCQGTHEGEWEIEIP